MLDVKEQIDEMLNVGAGTEAPSTEAAATEAAVTETPGTEAPGTEAPGTEAPTTEAPIEDEEKKRLMEENERLRKQIEDSLSPKTSAPGTKAPSTEAPIEEIDFLGEDVDLDELTRDTKVLNALLNKIYSEGIKASRAYQESTLRSIPDIVKNSISVQSTLRKEVESFYSRNKDLEPFKKVVANVYEELAAENPDWTIAKIFESVEEETRKRLELHKKAGSTGTPTTEAPRKPKFANVKGRQARQKHKTDSLLDEIDEMNKEI
jgi:hypothetical protein